MAGEVQILWDPVPGTKSISHPEMDIFRTSLKKVTGAWLQRTLPYRLMILKSLDQSAADIVLHPLLPSILNYQIEERSSQLLRNLNSCEKKAPIWSWSCCEFVKYP